MNPWIPLTFWLCVLWLWLNYGDEISKFLVRRFLLAPIRRLVCWWYGINYNQFMQQERERGES